MLRDDPSTPTLGGSLVKGALQDISVRLSFRLFVPPLALARTQTLSYLTEEAHLLILSPLTYMFSRCRVDDY